MNFSGWASTLSESTTNLMQRIVNYLPNVASAVALVLIGWLLAWMFRAISSRLIRMTLERLSRNSAIQRSMERTGIRQTIPKVVAGIVYWVVVLFFVAAGVERLELAVVTTFVSNIAYYLPKVLLGVLLVFVGFLGGDMIHHAVSSGAATAGITYAGLLGRIVQITILLVAVAVGADQIGIDSTFLMVTTAVVLGTTLGGAALAFGLGSGPVVGNIIASYYLQKSYRVGQTVRISGFEGKILELTPSAVVLEAADGRVLVPARKFTEESSVLVEAE